MGDLSVASPRCSLCMEVQTQWILLVSRHVRGGLPATGLLLTNEMHQVLTRRHGVTRYWNAASGVERENIAWESLCIYFML